MALERVPADIRAQGGVARMSDPKMIKEIMETVTIPVMAKARIGHFVECQVRSPISPLPCPPTSPMSHDGFHFSLTSHDSREPAADERSRSSKPSA
jgi:pyridoxal 5'-phosphate synthase pdxS subunit